MRLRLSHKLSIVMVVTVLVSAGLSAFFISRTTRSAFLELVRENDIRTASILAENVAAYYEAENSWDGIEKLLDTMNSAADPMSRQAPGMTRSSGQTGPMGMMPYRGGQGNRPVMRPELRILITDSSGRVVGHNLNMEIPDKLAAPVLNKGAPVLANNVVVGYLFVQSMLETAIGPFQQEFLLRVYRAIVLSVLVTVLSAPVVGLLLMRHITRPLLDLTEAAASVARRDFSFRPDIERSDEIGDLARSFFRMSGEIQAAEEWKKKLIADSAHELRTPVTLLQGNIEMMMDGLYPADREHLQVLFDETQILRRLVDELQDLAKAEAELIHYNFKNHDLKELFLSVVNTNRSALRKRDQHLEIRLQDRHFPVFADPQKLVQVMANVVQNAIRYTPTEGNILAELYEDGNHSAVCVLEDSGPGIPKEEREKVFQRFYRVQQDRNRETGGSGLGLAIAQEIVNRHEGSIRIADPRYLGGTRVEIRIPMGEESAAKGEPGKNV